MAIITMPSPAGLCSIRPRGWSSIWWRSKPMAAPACITITRGRRTSEREVEQQPQFRQHVVDVAAQYVETAVARGCGDATGADGDAQSGGVSAAGEADGLADVADLSRQAALLGAGGGRKPVADVAG